jgi:hypothetical protein
LIAHIDTGSPDHFLPRHMRCAFDIEGKAGPVFFTGSRPRKKAADAHQRCHGEILNTVAMPRSRAARGGKDRFLALQQHRPLSARYTPEGS